MSLTFNVQPPAKSAVYAVIRGVYESHESDESRSLSERRRVRSVQNRSNQNICTFIALARTRMFVTFFELSRTFFTPCVRSFVSPIYLFIVAL